MAACVISACIWSGIFHSIRSVCRERAIVKREYRTGLRLSSYVLAHVLYETALCSAEALIIQITLVADRDGMFTLHVRDSASTFNPFALPKADAGAQDVDFNAMGMQGIKERADSFYYRRYQGFNTMVVKI